MRSSVCSQVYRWFSSPFCVRWPLCYKCYYWCCLLLSFLPSSASNFTSGFFIQLATKLEVVLEMKVNYVFFINNFLVKVKRQYSYDFIALYRYQNFGGFHTACHKVESSTRDEGMYCNCKRLYCQGNTDLDYLPKLWYFVVVPIFSSSMSELFTLLATKFEVVLEMKVCIAILKDYTLKVILTYILHQS